MRIAQLNTMRGFYGGEVHLAALARGLRHEVTAVVRPDGELHGRLLAEGLPVFPCALPGWWEPRGVLALRAWLRRERIDVLHAHLPRDWFTAAVAAAGTPTVCIGTRHRLEPVAWPLLKRPFLARFGAMLAVSEAVRTSLAETRLVAPEKLLTVPNGLDLTEAPLSRAEARSRLGLAADTPVVGFVGRLCPDKDPALLVEAAARLDGLAADVQVVLIGGDPSGGRREADLGRRIRAAGLGERVRLAGYRTDAAQLCAAFDVLAVPSRAEPFGLVLLEALVRGVPVVATRAGGIPEIVRHGVEGLLVPPGDARALAAALQALLADPQERTRMGRAGRERVASAFSLEGMTAGVEAACRRALAGRAAAARPLSPACSAPPASSRR